MTQIYMKRHEQRMKPDPNLHILKCILCHTWMSQVIYRVSLLCSAYSNFNLLPEVVFSLVDLVHIDAICTFRSVLATY